MNNFLLKLHEYLRFFKKTYSQEGEDVVLAGYFRAKRKGFYVDIGAHHPFRFSNTYLFYKMGWSGINVDATPGSMKLFKKYRPRDINIEVPISNSHKNLNYYMFDESALNSFSSTLSKDRAAHTRYKIEKVVKLKPKKLSEILNNKLPSNQKIDFMSIDVEGHEYEVLISNNWNKYRPKYLLVEVLKNNSESIEKNKVYSYIISKGYKKIRRIGRTTLFKEKAFNK